MIKHKYINGKVIEELFQSILTIYQIGSETTPKDIITIIIIIIIIIITIIIIIIINLFQVD